MGRGGWTSDGLRGSALALLAVVDEGQPLAPAARALAVGVMREAVPDSPAWTLALAVVEGGPLRARRAVELAGMVLDAAEEGAPGEGAALGRAVG